jgi:sulfate transport system substrate-binding protein
VDIVYPSLSILAEPPVALVDKNVDRKGTRAVAQAYLEYLYSDEAQDLAGKHFYRPRHEKILAKYAAKLPKMQLFTLEKAFGSWEKVGKEHFADGGIFDQIYSRP